MNIFQRIGAALTRQIDRENEATSLNMATVKAEPDWKAIAEELAFELRVAGSRPYYPSEHRIFIDTVLARYKAAKQVKP